MNRALAVAALALPLVGLAAAVAVRETRIQGATPFVIPVTGHDPRDPLRGRYIRFDYRFTVVGDAQRCVRGEGCSLCLARDGLSASVEPPAAACAHRVDPAASGITVTPGDPPRFASRIFVSETSAPALEARLRQGPMRVRAVLTRDGRLVVRELIPAG